MSRRIFESFDPNHGLTPLEKCEFATIFKVNFYSLEGLLFSLQYRESNFKVYFCQKQGILILDQNVGLINASEKLGYCGGHKNLFYRLEKRFLFVLNINKRYS